MGLVKITPDGRWFQVPGYYSQPTRGLVRPVIAALWVEHPLEDLLRGGAALGELRGPGGRVARFVGQHPNRLLRDAGSNWWATDLEPAPEVEPWPHQEPAEPELLELAPPAAVEPGPPVTPAVEVEPDLLEHPEPEPAPEPLELSPPPEPAPAAPAGEPEPTPAPHPAPHPTPADAAAAAVINQGVAAIVEQLQGLGLLGGAGGLAVLPTEQVEIAPRRFQFRQVSHHGDLRNVSRWNPDLAGVLSVWRDPADGQVFVVDGHHRAGLARRLGVPTLAVRFMEAATDREARVIGAAINIAHGSASAIDAAKLIRDGGLSPEQVAAHGLPTGGRVLRDGQALALLAPELFERAAMGTLPIEAALALAAAGANYTLQRDLWQVARRNGWAAASIREAAEMASLATVRSTAGDGLLPGLELELEQSNLSELLAVRAAIRSRLRAEIRALGAATRSRDAATLQAAGNLIDREGSQVARSQAQVVADVFARLINCRGPLADVVQQLAAMVTPERSAAAVVDARLQLVREAIASELGSLGL